MRAEDLEDTDPDGVHQCLKELGLEGLKSADGGGAQKITISIVMFLRRPANAGVLGGAVDILDPWPAVLPVEKATKKRGQYDAFRDAIFESGAPGIHRRAGRTRPMPCAQVGVPPSPKVASGFRSLGDSTNASSVATPSRLLQALPFSVLSSNSLKLSAFLREMHWMRQQSKANRTDLSDHLGRSPLYALQSRASSVVYWARTFVVVVFSRKIRSL